jgi:type I restriction enzyme S subunit
MTLDRPQQVLWAGAVPKGWSSCRVKALFRDNSTPISMENLAALEVEHYSIPAFDECHAPAHEHGATIASNKTLLRGDEILFSKLNSHKPRVWIVPKDDKVKVASTEFIALSEWHPGTVNKTFLQYLLSSCAFIDYISCFQTSVTNSHRRISPEDLWRTRLPLPALEEQARIATYLEESCTAIDRAVAGKRRQLETLDALIRETIYRVVTQGLDPDVAVKPSGLDWVPRVPQHWKVRQIKRRCRLLRGKFSHRPRNDPALYDGEYPFIQTGDITAAQKYIRSYSQTLNELGFSVSKMFPKGTLVMSIAANVGDVAILEFEACFPDSMVGLVPDHQTNLDFLYYLMRGMKDILLRSAVLTTQFNLNYVRIGTNFAPFPPKKEQELIAAFVDSKIRDVLAIKETLNKQIDALVEYRKSLIHECVTGQRRVPEAKLEPAEVYA